MSKFGNKKMLWIIAATVVLLATVITGIILLVPSGRIDVAIQPQKVTLEVGQTQRLELVSKDADTQDLKAQWSSGDTSVATVSADGFVTAVAAGETKIVAVVSYDEKEYSAAAKITVTGGDGADKILIEGDALQEAPDIRGEKFTIGSVTEGVTYDMDSDICILKEELCEVCHCLL